MIDTYVSFFLVRKVLMYYNFVMVIVWLKEKKEKKVLAQKIK